MGKTVVITGSTRGIGFGLAEDGWKDGVGAIEETEPFCLKRSSFKGEVRIPQG